LAWVIDFAYTAELEKLTPETARPWASGAVDFLGETPTGPPVLHRLHLRRAGRAADPLTPLRIIQTRLREHLTTFAEEDLALVDAHITRVVWHQGRFVARPHASLAQWVDAALVSLLLRAGACISRCAAADCSRFFVKEGKRKYHSLTCQRRTGFARYVERHGITTVRQKNRAARHPRYAAKIHRRYPKAKIASRPR
jgi:hypothetical protein